jgi:3-oxoadipate enol-lactonase
MSLIRIGGEPVIAVEAQGTGELVLMLHGIGGSRAAWAPQLEALAPWFTAAAWDARGYGDSGDYEGPLEFADFSADLERVLDHFGAARAHLVGLSMGGRIALDFYARHPDRVATLTLADTSAGHPDATDPAKIDEALALRKKPLLEGRTPADIAPEVLAVMAGPSIDEGARRAILAQLSALRPASYIKTLEAVTRYHGFPDYGAIEVPTLVVAGEFDRIAKPEVARELAARIPDHRFVLIGGAGHVSNLEAPEAFNAALLDFLLSHRTAAGQRRTAPASEARA